MGLNLGKASGLWEIAAPLLEDTHKISHTPAPGAEAAMRKEPGSDPLAELAESPGEEGRKELGLTVGTQMLAAAMWGTSFYHKDTGAGKCPFGIHPVAYCWCKSELGLVAQSVKHLPVRQETQVQAQGQEDPLEKEMATHSSILAWEIP